MRETLHQDPHLTVTLTIEDDDIARVVLESPDDGPDLTVPDEVVVVADGQGCPLTIDSPNRAVAILGPAHQLQGPLTLMVRVFEFFEGWEFGDE